MGRWLSVVIVGLFVFISHVAWGMTYSQLPTTCIVSQSYSITDSPSNVCMAIITTGGGPNAVTVGCWNPNPAANGWRVVSNCNTGGGGGSSNCPGTGSVNGNLQKNNSGNCADYAGSGPLGAHLFGNQVSASGTLAGVRPVQGDLGDLPITPSNGGSGCTATTFATLPVSPVVGTFCSISNAAACTVGTAVTAAGSIPCIVDWVGSQWMPAGGASVSGTSISGQTCTLATCPITSSTVNADATSNAVSTVLPAATGTFNPYVICKIDTTANIVTVSPNATPGTDTIDGLPSFAIRRQNRCVRVVDSGSGKWLIQSSALIDSVRLAAPPSGASYPLLETVDFPANFQNNGIDPTSLVICPTGGNPSEADLYRIGCGSDIGSFVISTTGTTVFRTGTAPWVVGSTQQAVTVGQNGGAIPVPTGTVVGQLLVLVYFQAASACQAASIITDTAGPWSSPTGGTYTFTSTPTGTAYAGCLYTRLVTSTPEPASITFTCTNCYPAGFIVAVGNNPASTNFDVAPVWNHGNGTAVSILAAPATGNFSTTQDMYFGGVMYGCCTSNSASSLSPLVTLQNQPYTGANNAGAVGILPLTVNTQAAIPLTLSASVDWMSVAFAVAPTSTGGAKTCNVNTLLQIIPPSYTYTNGCPSTMGGHAS